MGRPWDWGKAFDLSAPVSAIHKASELGRVDKGRIWLAVNGKVKQESDLSLMIWPIPDIIAFLSRSMKIMPGDLVMTGTPEGVGAVVPGDRITGGIDRLGEIAVNIGPAEASSVNIAAE